MLSKLLSLLRRIFTRRSKWDGLDYGKPSDAGNEEWHRMNGER